MRKVIGLIVGGIIMFLLVACGENDASGSIMDRIPKDDDYKPLTQVIEEQTGLLPNDMVLSPGKHNIYGNGIDISFPLNWRANEAAGGRLAYGPEEHGEFYISVGTVKESSNYIGTLDELPEVTKDTVRRNIQYMMKRIEKFDISIKNTEYIKVNGIDFIKIKAIVNMDSRNYSYDQDMNYVAYYALISIEHPHVNYKDRPFFIGVIDYSEEQSHIDNAEKVLDAMVQTMELWKETD